MTTKIYGASDDLIEFEGDVEGEVNYYGTDEEGASAALVMCSDGTVLEVKYGKGGIGVWGITCIAKGSLYQGLNICSNENQTPHSDVAHFKDGLKWAYAAKEWERVR